MAEVAGVLDLTFMDITEEADLERVLTEKFSAPQAADSPTRTTRRKREEYRAIRLANNSIESLDILGGPIAKYLDCTKIQWLDLSFNAVRRVSDGFLEAFPNVTTLYFHANRISRLSEIKKISNFSQLRSLSLYGNPVEEHKVSLMIFVVHCYSHNSTQCSTTTTMFFTRALSFTILI